MTQEDKELLLKDLCARLPYGVICDCLHDCHTKASAVYAEDFTVYYPYIEEWEFIEYCKPYLRPMSSMTEDERKEYNHIVSLQRDYLGNGIFYTHYQIVDWFNKKMFDYRGLIEKGLAIKVTKENNPYKE